MSKENETSFTGCINCAKALGVIYQYGGIDGGHHKQWVLDQVVRAITGDKYDEWVKEYQGEYNEEEDEYEDEWETGIAP